MRPNALEFVKVISEVHNLGPIVEFGSKILPGQQSNLRGFFSKRKFIGCDIEKGDGVDRIDNCCKSRFGKGKVGTLIMCETLEHVEKIWLVFKEAKRILHKNGLMIVTMPFIFPIHCVPDYWRLTPQALDNFLSIFPHRMVFFQGKYNLPHTIFGIASNLNIIMGRTAKHLYDNMSRVPGSEKGETIYQWGGQTEWVENWVKEVVEEDQWYSEITGIRGKEVRKL